MRRGGPETAFDPSLSLWGIASEWAPISGTFIYATELEALAAARKMFPYEDPCLMRDSYHTCNS